MTHTNQKITLDVAIDKIKKVDNLEMIIDEHNIEEVFDETLEKGKCKSKSQ